MAENKENQKIHKMEMLDPENVLFFPHKKTNDIKSVD